MLESRAYYKLEAQDRRLIERGRAIREFMVFKPLKRLVNSTMQVPFLQGHKNQWAELLIYPIPKNEKTMSDKPVAKRIVCLLITGT